MNAPRRSRRSSSFHEPGVLYTQSRLYDCFMRWKTLKDQWVADCTEDQNKSPSKPETQTVAPNGPMQLPVHATFSWIEHDEDQLFGRTIVSMLRTLPLNERNHLKVHIFTLLAKAQCDLENQEFLV